MKTITTMLKKPRFQFAAAASLVLLMSGCATHAPAPKPNATAEEVRATLSCTLPSNCVNSLDAEDGGLKPLRFEGTSAQALAALREALAGFPEAKIVEAGDSSMEVVFTTSVGFKDLVDFRIDSQAKRIDYRSRSSLGLYDFGKNRSRMKAFAARFEQTTQR